MVKKQERLTQLSNIRALAIFIVVLGHSIILYSSGWETYHTTRSSPFLDGLKTVINVFQMPLFFSLSGFLFAFTYRKKRGFLCLLKNKAIRLLIPYLTVGLLFMMPIRFVLGYPGYTVFSPVSLLKDFLLVENAGHLWFLPALFLIFLLSELILTAAEHIPGLKKHPELVLGAAAALLYLEGYRLTFGSAELLNVFLHLPWFAWGYVLSIHRGLVKRMYRCGWLKWGLLIFNLGLAAYCFRKENLHFLLTFSLQALYILNIYGVIPEKSCTVTERLSRDSFGIYLFHSPLIYITFTLIPNAAPVIVVFVNLVIWGGAAWGITNLVRALKLGFLIGERHEPDSAHRMAAV